MARIARPRSVWRPSARVAARARESRSKTALPVRAYALQPLAARPAASPVGRRALAVGGMPRPPPSPADPFARTLRPEGRRRFSYNGFLLPVHIRIVLRARPEIAADLIAEAGLVPGQPIKAVPVARNVHSRVIG